MFKRRTLIFFVLSALFFMPFLALADLPPLPGQFAPPSPWENFLGLFFPFCVALFITLLVEIPTAYMFLRVTKKDKHILLDVLWANLISLPVIWLSIPALLPFLLDVSSWYLIIVAEVFAILFETVFLFLRNRDQLSIWQSLFLSFLMNVLSVFLGYFILLYGYILITKVLALFGFKFDCGAGNKLC